MSMESQADNELELLEADLMNGDITNTEYNRAVREIERDMAEYTQGQY